MDDARLVSPSAERNRAPILAVLREWLPPGGLVLEVASGSGEHALYFGQHLPDRTFQPSDHDAAARASIDGWVADSGLRNVRPALELDAAAPEWPVTMADAVLCINMIHISPWAATLGLLAGSARALRLGGNPGGLLYLYGPYRRGALPMAASNAAFDASLRARDPAWGIRDLDRVAQAAAACGFAAPDIREMPANNLSIGLRLRTGA